MNDTISRQAAIRLITGYNGVVDKSVAKRLLIQMPSAQPLTDEDYIELHDRFGTWVEEVVRGMISGEGKRWGNERRHDQPTVGDTSGRMYSRPSCYYAVSDDAVGDGSSATDTARDAIRTA